MSSLNFADTCLSPHITSDKPSLDGHEITNLISSNSGRHRRGFLAESFVKPPVDICISFPCNIDIEKIILGTKVKKYSTVGIEIFTHSVQWNPSDCWLFDQQHTRDISKEDPLIFASVGKAFNDQSDAFCFRNKRHVPRKPYKMWKKMKEFRSFGNVGNQVYDVSMHHHNARQVNSVSHLTIRLLRSNNYLCALQSIEVWGQPSFYCSGNSRLVAMLYSLSSPKKLPEVLVIEDSPTRPTSSSDYTKTDATIPSEFCDPLTFELMQLPVLLPSGHTIDQTSLNRHCDAEAKWGRMPSDPFTGQPFSEIRKPVPNTALKARIDQFVLHSDSLTQGIAIIGTKSSSYLTSAAVSTLVTPVLNEHKTENAELKEVSSNASCKRIRETDNMFDNQHTEDSTTNKKKCAENPEISHNHSDRLKFSLDDALLSALQSPSNSRTLCLNTSAIKCQRCASLSQMYQLNCKHYLCRSCLLRELKQTSSSCAKCMQRFAQKDIVKVH